MFQSATVKLTGWYLLILMSISLLFSVIIYQVAWSEINARLENLQHGILEESDATILPLYDLRALRNSQAHEAATSLFVGLFYANLLILVTGGIGSYLLARRTLGPIERAHEAQSRFTSDASHELRTPLAAMRTELEVTLRDPETTADEMRAVLQSNLEEVTKLSRLSHTLLQLSRLDHSDITLEKQRVADVVHACIKRHGKVKSRIRFTPNEQPLYVNAHQESLEELLTILIDNALKYSPAKSPVTIATRRRGSHAEISVTNRGKGIAPEDLPRIFDRFYRADTSRTGGKKSGYGLGLSLAKNLADLHGGEITADSTPGKSTTFTVSLPLFLAKAQSF